MFSVWLSPTQRSVYLHTPNLKKKNAILLNTHLWVPLAVVDRSHWSAAVYPCVCCGCVCVHMCQYRLPSGLFVAVVSQTVCQPDNVFYTPLHSPSPPISYPYLFASFLEHLSVAVSDTVFSFLSTSSLFPPL